MRVLLTAGGTREPIDDVRVIANTSTGRLGARLAEAFDGAGHEVTLLHGEGAAQPLARASRRQFGSSADLAALLRQEAGSADVIVHAAAVSDYLPERVDGKLGSDADELLLRLVRAPKLIDELRALAPQALIVGFKLSAGRSEVEREGIAVALLRRARLDLVVSNEVGRLGEDDHEGLIFGEQGLLRRAAGKRALAEELVEAVAERLRAQAGSA